jgi:hypothetical protein
LTLFYNAGAPNDLIVDTGKRLLNPQVKTGRFEKRMDDLWKVVELRGLEPLTS